MAIFDIEFEHTRIQGDTGDPFALTLTSQDVPYAIPNGSTVFLTLRSVYGNKAVQLNKGSMVPDPDQTLNPGVVRYLWGDAESVAKAGIFDIQILLVLPGGSEIRFPRNPDKPYGLLLMWEKLDTP